MFRFGIIKSEIVVDDDTKIVRESNIPNGVGRFLNENILEQFLGFFKKKKYLRTFILITLFKYVAVCSTSYVFYTNPSE